MTLFVSLFITFTTFAQAPEKMSYQAVIRDVANELVTNQTVGMQISILQGGDLANPGPTIVYSEMQTPTSNANGLVTLEIGTGSVVSGDFTTINWGAGTCFIKTETDPTGGSSFTIIGTSQLLSVPYALHTKQAANGLPAGGTEGQILAINASGTPEWQTPSETITLTTSAVSNIQAESATSGGDIAGSATAVTARGVCWSTSQNPTIIANSFTTDGTGIGTFNSELTGLTHATTYYVRTYATNDAGTTYGNEVSFTTLTPTLPTLTTTSVNNIGPNTAQTGGNISNGGGLPVTARGVCWSTSQNPTIIANSFTTDGTGIGTFNSELTGLTQTTTYYGRAYATNSLGTAYGNQVNFTTKSGSLPAIGQPYLGGILAYVLQSGDLGYDPLVPHGLIAAPTDLPNTVEYLYGNPWGCSGLGTNATGTAIGTGNQNTIDGCDWPGSAARLCGDLTLNDYNDWYFPSKDELIKLCLNIGQGNALGLGNVGGFADDGYWSSSEKDIYEAWYVVFSNPVKSYSGRKTIVFRVRPVRSF